MKTTQHIFACLACALSLSAAAAFAQTSGIKRELVQKADVSVPNREAIVVRVEIAPGVLAGRHTHPGDEISYVLEGEGEIQIDGEAPKKIKAGDAFVIPAGKIHNPKNTGTVPLKVLAVYVLEKGKTLATPAPAQ